MDQLYVARDFFERSDAHWDDAVIDRLAVVNGALARVLTSMGAEVVHVSGVGVLYNRPSDGAEVSVEPLFERIDYPNDPNKAYRFADRWLIEAPLPGGQVASARLAADPSGSPRVVASSLFMQISSARYAGQPLPYRNNR